jgi:DNA polymerase elongation subunit (family B)
MSVNEIVIKMQNKPYILEMGKGKLSRWFRCTVDEIREAKRIVRKKDIKLPKVLYLDIETAPLRSFTWRLWKQDIPTGAIISDWFMLSWAAKWQGSEGVMSQSLKRNEVFEEDDRRIVETLWHLLDQADIVCTHNGERFDIPKIRSRFLVNGLPPTSNYLQIDTLKIVRKEFGFSSNKLDYIAKILGIEGKLPTGLDLWIRCMKGETAALKQLEEYNRNDVIVLENVYMKLRPYMKSHPNFNMWSNINTPVCPHCGSNNLIEEKSSYYTQTGQYKTHRCLDCGAVSRERKSILPKEKSILVSIPGR